MYNVLHNGVKHRVLHHDLGVSQRCFLFSFLSCDFSSFSLPLHFPWAAHSPPLRTSAAVLPHYRALSWKNHITLNQRRGLSVNLSDRDRQMSMGASLYYTAYILYTLHTHRSDAGRELEGNNERKGKPLPPPSVYPGTKQTTCLTEQWQEPISLK